MADKSQRCSSETEGLILSSFQVLQDSRPHCDLKLACSFLADPEVVQAEHNQNATGGHVCVTEAAEGDEMFDVTDSDQFRGDEVGDCLDNSTSNCLDREDDDEEEEEEDEDDDDGRVERSDSMQVISSTKPGVTAETNGGTSPDIRAHLCPPESFQDLASGLRSHGYLDPNQDVWHSDGTSGTNRTRISADWHMALNSGNNVSSGVLENGVLSGPILPGENREVDGEEEDWKFVHGHEPASDQHLWGRDEGAGKVVVAGSVGQSWVTPKQDVVVDHQHEIQNMHHRGSVESSGHWSQRLRSGQAQVHGWHKDIGGVISPEEDINAVRSLFNLQAAQNSPAVSNSFTDLACANSGTWNLNNHLASGALPQPVLHELACRRGAPATFYHQSQNNGYTGYQGPGREAWQQTAMNAGTTAMAVDGAAEHFKMADVQSSVLCKSAILNKRGKGRNSKCGINIPAGDIPSKCRSALDQARQQAHPYQMKEQKKMVRDVYPATSANVHTLKASHIVSWYIDYLIHENEHLTQISRAFSLPVNLFLSDDFYFMDSLKKKVHFPSLKFLSWMQQNLPSINVNAIDFHEGRPPVVSTWNQDWFWQNKSRRDIIHDVFFYFQHRRVTCEN